MLLRDIGNRDFDKVQGTVLLIAVVVLVIGFLVDVAHYLIDPRLRTGAAMKWLRIREIVVGAVGLVLVRSSSRSSSRTSGFPTTRDVSESAGWACPSTTGSAPTLRARTCSPRCSSGAGQPLRRRGLGADRRGDRHRPRRAQRSHRGCSASPSAYFIDVLIALPTLVLALVLVGLFKGSLVTVSLAIGVSSGVVLARILRAEAAGVLARDYILAARRRAPRRGAPCGARDPQHRPSPSSRSP